MTYTLISSSPSPYARKVRVAMLEKGIPFELQTEVPWDSTTETPAYNPLEKLPVLIMDDGKTAIYESHFIFEWLEAKYPSQTPLLPPEKDLDQRLKAKQVEVVVDGVCDALLLWIWESRREEQKQSAEWTARQDRKVKGGLKKLNEWIEEAKGGYIVNNKFGLADIAVGSLLGFMNLRQPDATWKQDYPAMKEYWEKLEERQSFKDTRPFPFEIKDKVV